MQLEVPIIWKLWYKVGRWHLGWSIACGSSSAFCLQESRDFSICSSQFTFAPDRPTRVKTGSRVCFVIHYVGRWVLMAILGVSVLWLILQALVVSGKQPPKSVASLYALSPHKLNPQDASL